MTSQIESSRRHQYTPLEEKQLLESRNKSMETTTVDCHAAAVKIPSTSSDGDNKSPSSAVVYGVLDELPNSGVS